MISKLKDYFFPNNSLAYEEEILKLIESGNIEDLQQLIEVHSINPHLLTKVKPK
jgi:hypothetical protein